MFDRQHARRLQPPQQLDAFGQVVLQRLDSRRTPKPSRYGSRCSYSIGWPISRLVLNGSVSKMLSRTSTSRSGYASRMRPMIVKQQPRAAVQIAAKRPGRVRALRNSCSR